ncbi:hypothetical protein [Agitococcus lubricus]|uniref:Uncharacterized protein n=1 Tax=Agitococcus lubricus TaxID=1077255 RepID=A0A2T5IY75_9GAMM|nr:hypothetical protein [Agitococcus lubricus]PTQ88912.1 hypothetical protein C8N29_11061 [Agitococcus lubricus]
MTKLLLTILGILGDKLRLLIVITLILCLGSWLQKEWHALEQAQQDHQRQQQLQAVLNQRHTQLVAAQALAQQTSQTLQAELSKRQLNVNGLNQQLQQLKQHRETLWEEHWLARHNPISRTSLELRRLDLKIAALQQQMQLAQQAVLQWQQHIQQAPATQALTQLGHELQQSNQLLAAVKKDLADSEHILSTSLVKRTGDSISAVLPSALMILAAVILLPILFKLIQYFVLAPIVSRLAPIRLLAASPNHAFIDEQLHRHTVGHISQPSLTIQLAPRDELLIHPDYLQSFSKYAHKSTQWLLNPQIPLTSWAAGLVTLVKLQSDKNEHIQLASMSNPLEELAVLSLPAGSQVVCKPRALAGVIKQREHAVYVSRHWRLFSLHAWLTLQLRYLVFHGECQLIVKGHHGIIVEHAGEARLVQQQATLGFSPDIAYSNYRCETFISYYLGKDSLFNDQFSGEAGLFFYEQAPHDSTAAGVVKRTMGGIWDAILKVFGI